MTKTTHYKERNLERVREDIGNIYGVLKIKDIYYKKIYEGGRNRAIALCTCICGNEKEAIYSALIKGDYKSCGCMNEKRSALGLRQQRPWRIRYAMIKSVRNPRASSYHRRGAKGITVQDKRKTFAGRWEDNKDLYSDEMYFTRKNVFKDFTSDNCIRAIGYNQSAMDLFDKYKDDKDR